MALAGDGHTFLAEPDTFKSFPLEFFTFPDGVRLVRSDPAYKSVLGWQLIAVNGQPLQKVLDSLKTIIPKGESSLYLIKEQSSLLNSVNYLHSLGFMRSKNEADFTFAHLNQRSTISVKPMKVKETLMWLSAYNSDPLFLRLRSDCLTDICHLPLNQDAYYISFVSYPSWEEMETIGEAIRDSLEAKTAKLKIIIDMRLNGGGNFYKGLKVLLPQFLDYKAAHPEARFYVIIGRHTFSAGMSNAVHFHDCLNAILVGEPTGAKPNGYQENKWFELPNSRLRVSCSQLYYAFQKQNTNGVQPNHCASPDFVTYKSGRDRCLDWILNQ